MTQIQYIPAILPAEWEEQDAVLITWPHPGTDWAATLPSVEKTYLEIARLILKKEKLLVTGQNTGIFRSNFSEEECMKILFFEIPSNDTWARDFGPVCTFRNGTKVVNDFTFNGWGNKFSCELDNRISARLFEMGAFSESAKYCEYPDFVLEGGSIESDGKGTILTTSECLLNPNRNPKLTKEEIEEKLKIVLGARRILWLNHGGLKGDDTDSHIDTLARFCDEKTICYVKCNDRGDIHYPDLKNMEEELRGFMTEEGDPYRLIPLPMADPVYNGEGKRMPATYANFLLLNQTVLVPLYGVGTDGEALEVFRKIFPEREIKGVNCYPLIEQNGSLHCITLQIPKGFLK